MPRERRNQKRWNKRRKSFQLPNIVNCCWSEKSWWSIQESQSNDKIQRQVDWINLFYKKQLKWQTHSFEESQQSDFESNQQGEQQLHQLFGCQKQPEFWILQQNQQQMILDTELLTKYTIHTQQKTNLESVLKEWRKMIQYDICSNLRCDLMRNWKCSLEHLRDEHPQDETRFLDEHWEKSWKYEARHTIASTELFQREQSQTEHEQWLEQQSTHSMFTCSADWTATHTLLQQYVILTQ